MRIRIYAAVSLEKAATMPACQTLINAGHLCHEGSTNNGSASATSFCTDQPARIRAQCAHTCVVLDRIAERLCSVRVLELRQRDALYIEHRQLTDRGGKCAERFDDDNKCGLIDLARRLEECRDKVAKTLRDV